MDTIIKNILCKFKGKKHTAGIKNLIGFFGVIIDINGNHFEYWDRNDHQKIVFDDLLNEIKPIPGELKIGDTINFLWMEDAKKMNGSDILIDNHKYGILIESTIVSDNPNNFIYKSTNIKPGTYSQKIDNKKLEIKYKYSDIHIYKYLKFSHIVNQTDICV